MKHEYTARTAQLYERYPDLLSENDDPEMVDLIQALDVTYTASEPPAHLTFAAALAQRRAVPTTVQVSNPGVMHTFRPKRRVAYRAGLVAALVAIFVLLVGAGYGTLLPLLNWVFNMEPGTQQVLQDNMYTKINQSRTIDGFTFTLARGYADANRVIIGFTVTKPKPPVGHTYNSTELAGAVLSTQQGLVLPPRGGSGYGGGQGNDASAASFDAAALSGNPRALQLHFVAQGLFVNDFDGKSVHSYQLPGQVSFDFTLPFHPGRVVNPHLSVTVHGVTVTLERVVVTLSETRMYLRCPGACFVDEVSGDGWDSQHGFRGPEMDWTDPGGLAVSSYWDAFYSKHGQWTFHVMADPHSSLAGQGPWIFHVTIP